MEYENLQKAKDTCEAIDKLKHELEIVKNPEFVFVNKMSSSYRLDIFMIGDESYKVEAKAFIETLKLKINKRIKDLHSQLKEL